MKDRALLAVVTVLMFAVRLAVVVRLPELDSDAYGHFLIAKAAVREPANLDVHWVWLPLFHWIVGGLRAAGVSMTGVRAFDALLQLAGPWMLWDALRALGQRKEIALVAGLALALAPITNVLGTSAQPETLFGALVLFSAWALARKHATLAALALAAACLVRYEAWACPAAIVSYVGIRRLRGRRTPEIPLVTAIVPVIAIAAWVVARRVHDGEWLRFVRETWEFTAGLRAAYKRSPAVEIAWLPLVIPGLFFGPAIVLAAVGARRAAHPAWIASAGVLAFLVVSYAGKGAFGSPRYFGSVVPFACAALAEGAFLVAERFKLRPALFTRAALASLALLTAFHLRALVTQTLEHEAGLRAREARVSAS